MDTNTNTPKTPGLLFCAPTPTIVSLESLVTFETVKGEHAEKKNEESTKVNSIESKTSQNKIPNKATVIYF